MNDNVEYSSESDDDMEIDVNVNDDGYQDSDYDANDDCITNGSDVSSESNVSGESGDKEDDDDEDDGNSIDRSAIERWSGTSLRSNLPDFNGKLCLSRDILPDFSKHPSSIDVFHLFLTPEITNYIVDQSNLYRIQNSLTQQDPMTEDDLHQLLGFLYYSSIIPLPSKSDYWSIRCRQALIADSITRNRIDYLLTILHFNDNTIENDKAEKIEPLIHLFNDRCLAVVEPERNISIDEQMIGYKGKSAPKSFKQYMPNKPTKRGYKFWAKCGVSGFVYEVKLYHGTEEITLKDGPPMSLNRTLRSTTNTFINNEKARDEADERRVNIKALGLSGVVVLDFLENIPNGSRIFINNYFASYNLMKKMTILGYGLTCTLRQNRINKCPVPTEKAMKKKPRGYCKSFVTDDEGCIVIAWKDSKRVLLGSNCVGEEPVVMLKRWSKEEGNYIQVPAPKIVEYYNKHMGGVDTLDMMISLHPIPFRSKKWYTRIIWRIFDLMIINSWILINHLFRDRRETEDAGNWRKFRLFNFKNEVAKYLLQKPKLQQIRLSVPLSTTRKTSNLPLESSDDDNEANPPKKPKREYQLAVDKQIRFDGFNHLPKFLQAKNATRCKNEGCKQKARWCCTKCDIHLCLTPRRNCFNEYHTNN